jgi:hypothetical protein
LVIRINAVRFRRLHSGPGFSHHAVEAEATLGPGDDPDTVLLDLKTWVGAQLGLVETQAATSAELERLKAETAMWRAYADRSRAEHEWFRQRIEKMMNLIGQAHDAGVKVDEELWQKFLEDEIPF